MPVKWVKGQSVYADWLKTLTKEEYDAHLLARREKKSMRLAMEAVVKEQQAVWIAGLNNAAAVLLAKAVDKGDPVAFNAVWDRIIGKPRDVIEVEEAEKPMPWDDNFDDEQP